MRWKEYFRMGGFSCVHIGPVWDIRSSQTWSLPSATNIWSILVLKERNYNGWWMLDSDSSLHAVELYNRMCCYEYEYIYYTKWNFIVLFVRRSWSWSRDQGTEVLVFVSSFLKRSWQQHWRLHWNVDKMQYSVSVWYRHCAANTFDAHCCHTGAAIKHPVPERVKPSFVMFDIRALSRLSLR